MGLKAYQLEAMDHASHVKHDAALQYIDDAENEGINPIPAVCPRHPWHGPQGHMPKGLAIVSSNLPVMQQASYPFSSAPTMFPSTVSMCRIISTMSALKSFFAEDVKA